MSLQIRKSVYRNRVGLLICGRHENSGIFGTQMFVDGQDPESYRIAQLLKSRVVNNEDTRVEDWRRTDGRN